MGTAPIHPEALQAAFESFLRAKLDDVGSVLHRHPELLSDDADVLLKSRLQTEQDLRLRQFLQGRRELLQRSREVGIDAALAEVSNALKFQADLFRAFQAEMRFQQGRDPSALNEELAVLEGILHDPLLAAAALRLHLTVLTLAGSAHYGRYRIKGTADDLDRSIELLEQLVVHSDAPEASASLDTLGNALRDRYQRFGRQADLDRAIQSFQQAVDLGGRDPVVLAGYLGNLGVALRARFERYGRRSDLDLAIQAFQQAVTLARSASHLTNLGRALIGRYDYRTDATDLTDLEEALKMFKEAVREATPEVRPTCLNNLGNGLMTRYGRLGDPADLDLAVHSLREAVAETPPDSSARAVRLSSLGVGLRLRAKHFGHLQDLEEAIEVLDEGVRRTPPDSPELPGHRNSFGIALRDRYSLLGVASDLERAIDAFRQAVEETPHDSPDRSRFLTNLGTGLENRYIRSADLADLQQAIRAFGAAVEEAPQSPTERTLYLNNLGIGWRKRHRHTTDRADLDHALGAFQQAVTLTPPDSPDRVGYLINLGTGLEDTYDLTGRIEDLESAIANYQQAAAQATSRPSILALSLNNFGFASFKRHIAVDDPDDLTRAIDAFQRAAGMTSSSSPMLPLYLDHLGQALLRQYRASGNSVSLDEAVKTGERAWTLFESTFGVVPMAYKIGQQVASATLAAWLVDAYLRRATLSGRQALGDHRRAMEIAEGSKSRVLTELIGRQLLPLPPDLPPDLTAREVSLLHELTVIDSTVLAARGNLRREEEPFRAAEAFKRREECRMEIQQLWQEIAQHGGQALDYVALRRGEPLRWADLTALAGELGPDTALVSLFSTGETTCLFIFRTGWDCPTVIEVPLSSIDWAEIVARLFGEVHASRGTSQEETWTDRLCPFLERAAGHLQNVSRIVFAPEARGHLIPWAVVSSEAGWGGYGSLPTIVTLPALALLRRLRRRPARSTGVPLVVGNPTGGLDGAEREAYEVARSLGTEALIGSLATKSAVLERLPQASIVHLATHASFDRSSPLDSYIELADGALTAREILACRMPTADLLVLSACETGLAGSLGGDELAGLAQAFFYAGARSLVVSLWQVNDPATALLMTAFYSARQSGADKASALTQAMAQVRAQKQWSHPYYWGAFVMMGDWN